MGGGSHLGASAPETSLQKERLHPVLSRGLSFPFGKAGKVPPPPWKPDIESGWSSELCPCRNPLPGLSPPSSHFTCPPPQQFRIHWVLFTNFPVDG